MPEDASEARRPSVLIRPLPIVLGVLAGLGVAVLLQQYAVTPLTVPLLLGLAVAGAVVIGIGLPTLLLHTMKPKQAPPAEKEGPQ